MESDINCQEGPGIWLRVWIGRQFLSFLLPTNYCTMSEAPSNSPLDRVAALKAQMAALEQQVALKEEKARLAAEAEKKCLEEERLREEVK
jgi:hypothetical protein